MATTTGHRVDDIAHDLLSAVTHLALSALRTGRRVGDLKEIEYLCLSLLNTHRKMIVGDLQRLLGVLPAQMSRIIRSLENRVEPLIHCQINASDKRKIDVYLTPEGEKALADYKETRVGRITDLLQDLPDDEQEDLGRLAHKLNSLLDVPA